MKMLIYLILLIGLLIASLSFKEGFESGQYGYLAPHVPAVLDATTQASFIDVFNKSGAVLFPDSKIVSSDTKIITDFKTFATLDEFNYYIQNKKWPYNSYLMNYLNTNKATLLEQLKHMKIYSLEDLQKILPTRVIYTIFINSKESAISPKPLSNDIFMGKQPPPVDAPAAKPSTEPKATIHPPFSSENYTKLQSICSTLK